LAVKVTTTHTHFLTYTPDIWEACKATDVNPDNSNEVLLIYGYSASGNTARTRNINQNGGNAGDWNREHVFARSLGNPNLGTTGAGADAHHLRACDAVINSTRNNKKFADGSGNSGSVSGGWYPGDEWKGDVARMIMYMYIRYGNQCLPSNVGVGNNSGTPDDMIDLFLQWNVEDPVSDFERQRNTYHENTSNPYAQGNRNPFIDNPILATRIWGGPIAEDTWGIYTTGDTEAPTAPTNLTVSNPTTSSLTLSWNAATDNVAVTSYDIYKDGNLSGNTSNTTYTFNNLPSNTTFQFYVIAKDIANNQSPQSNTVSGSTLEDTQAPSVPSNVIASSQTDSSFKIVWDAATDDTGVVGYDIYLDGILTSTTQNTEYTFTGLTASTTYTVTITAKDAANNISAQSTPIEVTTTDGSTNSASELFFSEYVEGSSNNKALEIVNVTANDINLSGYSIKRNRNGGSEWSEALNLSGTIAAGDVFVIINGAATIQHLIDEADLIHPNSDPINFNGNDPVGLFKNGVLIDIIGTFNGGSAYFAKDKTLRRKANISSPNTSFNLENEWDVYPKDNTEDIGQHNSALSTENNTFHFFKVYPNPVKSILYIDNLASSKINKISIYTLLGKKVLEKKTLSSEINVSFLHKGIYVLKLQVAKKIKIFKFIKN